jgi:uncharacterized protein involved in exopolysaccharide biosynthesis
MDDVSSRHRSRRFLGSVVRTAAMLLTTALVGTGMGLGAATLQQPGFRAQATVLVTPLEGNPFNPQGNGDDLENLASEAELVNSDAVAKKVSAQEPGVSSSDLLNGLTVTIPPNTQVLTIDYEAGSPGEAVARAQGFASGFLALRAERASQSVVAQARTIKDAINVQSDRLDKLAEAKARVSGPERRAVIQQQMDGVTAQVVQLSTTLSAVQTIDQNPGEVITPAHAVGRSPEETRVLFEGIGLLVGLAAGVAILVLGARRNHVTRRGDEAAGSVGDESSVDDWATEEAGYPGDLVGRGRP